MTRRGIYISSIALSCIIAILGGYLYKTRIVYTPLPPSLNRTFHLNSNQYDVLKIDSDKIAIHNPEITLKGIRLKIALNNIDFLDSITPLMIMINDSNKRGEKLYYDLRFSRNLITLSDSTLNKYSNPIIMIGYYRYRDIFLSLFQFYSRTFNVNNEKGKVTQIKRDFTADPSTDGGRVTINRIVEQQYIIYKTQMCYVYGYEIDETFQGFKDKKNELISGDAEIILKNGSKYKGYLKEGYFNGQGEFIDSLLNKTYVGEFTDGELIKDSIIDINTRKRIVQIPFLSTLYPVDNIYRREYLYEKNNKNVEHAFYRYREGQFSSDTICLSGFNVSTLE